MNLYKNKYCINKNISFHPNYSYLTNIYLPLIGSESLSLYLFLSNDTYINNSSESSHDLNRLLNSISVDYDSFMKSRKILEAFGLIKTFFKKDEIEKKNIFIFKILEPLDFNNFCSNIKYKKSLLNKVGLERFQELEFFYSDININESEIIEDYTDIFSNNENDNEFYFDFEKLINNLSKLIKGSVFLEKETMYLVEHYFKNYNLSINEIESAIFNSIDYLNNDFSIRNEILEAELSSKCEEKNKINRFNIIEIDRIENFFDEEQDELTNKKMYSIYKNTRPEDFLSSIQKYSISNIEVSIIRKLRNEFHLSNDVINIAIDFSIKKTHGKLNSNYLFKVAKTLNTLNCTNCKKAHNYFLSLSTKNKNNFSSNADNLDNTYVKLFN